MSKKPKASRGAAMLFFGSLFTIATGLILHGYGFRLSIVIGFSILVFAIAPFILANLLEPD